MGLRSDIWVAAYLRRAISDNSVAVLRRRGSPEAGAIYVLVNRLDGRVALFEPAPSQDEERRWTRAHKAEWLDPLEAETRLRRQIDFDPDIWVIETERRDGEHGLDLANG